MESSILSTTIAAVSNALETCLHESEKPVIRELKEYGLLYPEVKERQRHLSEYLLNLALRLSRYLGAEQVSIQKLDDVLDNYESVINSK